MRKQVVEFIKNSGARIAYDPFAGQGHLLHAAEQIDEIEQTLGLDIDESLPWPTNDSLLFIPHVDDAIIITNPPYLSSYSASRKKIGDNVERYFSHSIYDDVYMIALDKMLQAQANVVAIIPETFINSAYRRKDLLHSITILEENPFDDTDAPVLVACFDSKQKDLHQVAVYSGDQYVNSLGNLNDLRLIPDKSVRIDFNNRAGWLGVRCVDTTNPQEMIRFDFKENIPYDWQKGIKVSSRLLTLIDLDIPQSHRQTFIDACNGILSDLRQQTADLILSPFKGNMKNGRRRRRLDFLTCRAIIEEAYKQAAVPQKTRQYEQLRLF